MQMESIQNFEIKEPFLISPSIILYGKLQWESGSSQGPLLSPAKPYLRVWRKVKTVSQVVRER